MSSNWGQDDNFFYFLPEPLNTSSIQFSKKTHDPGLFASPRRTIHK